MLALSPLEMTEAYSSELYHGISAQSDVVRDDILTMVYDFANPTPSNVEDVSQFEIVVEESMRHYVP